MEKEYTFNNIDLCRQCGGTGREVSESGVSKCCELCRGSGLVEIEKKIKVTIRPHDPRGGGFEIKSPSTETQQTGKTWRSKQS